jgi:NAD-dependent DNA ligase
MLKIGKLDNKLLEDIVFRNIRHRRPEVLTRPGVGEDCAVIDFGSYECVVSTDPITAASAQAGSLAIHVSCNDIASNGIAPIGVMLAVLLPEGTDEEEVRGIMREAAEAVTLYFADGDRRDAVRDLISELSFEEAPEAAEGGILDGQVFVITGGLKHYPNRNALKELIESLGGKVTGSVTSNTSCLINNDRLSGSAKNKSARSLGVAVIDEEQLAAWIESGIPPVSSTEI